ncbi:BEN domain-containing protein [Phthorimaea operculella]|nr:BEN domain-containing protein [Phthorimaea operculella]
MSSTRKSEKWLLIQWSSGGRDVVNIKSVISPISEAKVGTVIIADKGNGNHEAASVIGYSHNRQTLERHIALKAEPKEEQREEEAQTAEEPAENEEPEDFSASASDWEPGDEQPSSDEEVERKKIKVERFNRSYTRRDIKPSHRANAVEPNMAKKRKKKNYDATNEGETSNIADKRSLPDSTRTNNSPAPGPQSDIVSINVQDILEMKQCFEQIFSILRELRSQAYPNELQTGIEHEVPLQPTGTPPFTNYTTQEVPLQPVVTPVTNYTTYEDNVDEDVDISDRSEDLNRSDDNVLITNKYDKANVLIEKDKNQNDKPDEWIPIGSGKTLIHKDQYRKVNWKSYTIATRTLLLAVFPRRILATHSLTGKRSPAFQNKPAKMCLDPKIVSDVIIEITDRFKVKENHVRSIITTKCADECKMQKMRQQLAKKRKSLPANKENDEMDDEDNEANVTC